ncbi:MAG: OsmC family protein [Clostridia bacterium]|nr:OsmC family protein [Clostridia bacterium]
METTSIEFDYGNRFYGVMHAPRAEINIGNRENQLSPYDMMFGALSSCLYATFLGITYKKKISFDSARMIITGEKRETIPTTLKWVNIKIIIKNPEDEDKFTKSFELATKYCSVFETIKQVADMSYEVLFEK